MTDVVAKASGANPIKNGGYVICGTPRNPLYGTSANNKDGNLQSEDLNYYQSPHVSGVGGAVTNRWDTRFDEKSYYST